MKRGIFWDLTERESVVGDAIAPVELRYLNDHGMSSVHLWINEQPERHAIDTIWSPFRTTWSTTGITSFTQSLKEVGLEVVFTLSPWFSSPSWLNGLKPLFQLASTLGAQIEFDMEGNLTEPYRPPGVPDQVPESEAKALMLDLLKGAPFGVTTSRAHLADHKDLVSKAAWVAPQSYHAGEVEKDVAALRDMNFKGQILAALSVENYPPGHADNVPLAVFSANLEAARKSDQVSEILIWSRRNLQKAGPGRDGRDGTAYAKLLEVR